MFKKINLCVRFFSCLIHTCHICQHALYFSGSFVRLYHISYKHLYCIILVISASRLRGQAVKAPRLQSMVLVQNPLAPFCCVLGKDTLLCLAILATSSKLKSYLYQKFQLDSNILASPEVDRGNCLPYALVLRRFPASQEDKYRDKINLMPLKKKLHAV